MSRNPNSTPPHSPWPSVKEKKGTFSPEAPRKPADPDPEGFHPGHSSLSWVVHQPGELNLERLALHAAKVKDNPSVYCKVETKRSHLLQGGEEPWEMIGTVSVRELVEGVNECRAPEHRQRFASLQKCVRDCIRGFVSEGVGSWAEEDAADMEEYIQLASIRVDKKVGLDYFREEKVGLMKEFSASLSNRTDLATCDDRTLAAISSSFCRVDMSVFGENRDWVLKLGSRLLDKMACDEKCYTLDKYVERCIRFCALQKALIIAAHFDSERWDVVVKRGIFSQLMERLVKKDSRARYYPMHFQVLVLEQSLLRLVPEGRSQLLYQDVPKILRGMLDASDSLWQSYNIHILQSEIMGRGFGFYCISAFCREIRKWLLGQGVREQPWYTWIVQANCAYIRSLDGKENIHELRKSLAKIKNKEKLMTRGEERIALRFGYAQQLCMVSMYHPAHQQRTESLEELLSCVIAWQEDVDVSVELLEGLIRIAHLYQRSDEVLDAKLALESVKSSLGGTRFWSIHKLIKKQAGVHELLDKLVST